MKKIILVIYFLNIYLFAGQCADEFSPQKFDESPSFFEDLVDISALGQKPNDLGFIQKGDLFYKPNSFIVYKDYIYPTVNGLWSYKIDAKGKIYEANISQIESGILSDTVLADMLNSDFEDTWRKWEGDGYEHYMEPEFVRFKYKDYYLSLKVVFWGVEGDSAKVKKSTVNYQIIDFTDEVNDYIRCVSKYK